MTLYVIAGHGAGDPGACGNGYTEAERVRALAGVIAQRGGNSVKVLDTSRNWYADEGINSLSIPKGDALIELHMDSASPSARGGHVEIKRGFSPDAYDVALGKAITSLLPGRQDAGGIRYRSDLANVNRAAKRGINYRLLECGFITNSVDVQIFNTRMTEVADAILGAFGISSTGTTTTVAEPTKVSIETVDGAVYRLYNASTGDHLFTQSHDEAETVAGAGWKYEGVAWYVGDGDPVERLYNPYSALHMLTASMDEHNSLVSAGWTCEGEAFRSGSGADVYRLYNQGNGAHHFTTSTTERDELIKAGWSDEGVAFKSA